MCCACSAEGDCRGCCRNVAYPIPAASAEATSWLWRWTTPVRSPAVLGPASVPGRRPPRAAVPVLAPAHRPGWWSLGAERSPGVLERPAGATPGLRELREQQVRGGLKAEIDAAMRRTPVLIGQLEESLPSAHFPDSLPADIHAAIGPPEGSSVAVGPEPAAQQRDPAFGQLLIQRSAAVYAACLAWLECARESTQRLKLTPCVARCLLRPRR